jgi:hypothetical protein
MRRQFQKSVIFEIASYTIEKQKYRMRIPGRFFKTKVVFKNPRSIITDL